MLPAVDPFVSETQTVFLKRKLKPADISLSKYLFFLFGLGRSLCTLRRVVYHLFFLLQALVDNRDWVKTN